MLALAVPVLLMARDDFADDGPFYPLLLSSLYGFCLLMSGDSFLTLFLGLEIMSIPVYVMVLLAFRRPESVEAALKYLVLGGTATALFLMGVSLLYGGTRLARAVGLHCRARFDRPDGDHCVSSWCWSRSSSRPRSYRSTPGRRMPTKARAFRSRPTWPRSSRRACVLAALRLFGTAPVSPLTVDLLAILPLVSIVWGNLTAMRQTSFRRMIAYSSIAHAGYLFYAFLGAGPGRFQAVVFYLIAYALMNLLAFASIPPGDDDTARDNLDAMKGLFQRNPYAAVMIAMAMLSLAGIPPFPGFVAKFLIFKNVMAAGFTAYAVLGLVGSYLGIYFYLRVIQYLFMSAGESAAPAKASARLPLYAGVLCLVATVVVAVFPGWILSLL